MSTNVTEIEIKDISFSYSEAEDVLRSVSLQINQGAFAALIGQNGSGKTTLAKHMLGLLRPREGKVMIQGDDIRSKAVGEIARRVGYVFQNRFMSISATNPILMRSVSVKNH